MNVLYNKQLNKLVVYMINFIKINQMIGMLNKREIDTKIAVINKLF